ncbi:hypothetical protein NDU88_004358 [Pleurodeles waltl]|uniref:Myb/SANT-like DNA-binding domain-containing protein n=1 Tax=Pleurodeles waltl TaxID=8319 RepID=A0AAV7KXH1_PLEWA|nr:hypothetical protein NDU88_004358 [Pleurodeles waltl]
MVEEIVRVEPQLFGTQVQNTTIARKMELWQRIVDRVNAVGQHPRNRDDIRKRWNDLRGKDPNATTPPRRVQKCPSHPQKRPTVMTAALSPWTQMTSPAHRGPRDSRFLTDSHRPQQTYPPLGTPAQHPPSGPMPLSPGHVNQRCVHHYRAPRLTHHPNNNRDLGAVVVGTPSRGQRPMETGELGGLLCDGGNRPREPTLHEALSSIMGAYHHSQETMATVLARFQEIQVLQEEQFMGFREELRHISSAMGTIVVALNQIVTPLRDHVAPQRAPVTSMDQEQASTSAGASGQEARHKNNRPPEPHPLQKENHPTSGA